MRQHVEASGAMPWWIEEVLGGVLPKSLILSPLISQNSCHRDSPQVTHLALKGVSEYDQLSPPENECILGLRPWVFRDSHLSCKAQNVTGGSTCG